MRANIIAITALTGVVLWTGTAQAGGYDTPMLYSARHMGMGGTAVGYVYDPSAMFHNPAGLGHIDKASVLGDFSLLFGGIQGSPAMPNQNVESNTTVAPFFLVGGGVRITDWLVAGLAVYPVASAGATYEYTDGAAEVEDSTTLLFFEASPGFAVNIDEARLNIGAGYRITYVSLDRTVRRDGTPTLALCIDGDEPCSLTGLDFLGFRVGAQWEAIEDHLSIGISYRHKTVTTVESDQARAIGMTLTDGETDFTLPSRLTFGVRGDYEQLGGAIDVEYGFNSQNERSTLAGTLPSGDRLMLDNLFDWNDSVTLRVGVEYRIPIEPERTITPRLGYVFDAKTANEHYPTAFGTPPAPTHVFTAGVGYDGGSYEVNLAFAHRRGSATVTQEDIDTAPEVCAFCGNAGEYEIVLNGIYLDLSYDFE